MLEKIKLSQKQKASSERKPTPPHPSHWLFWRGWGLDLHCPMWSHQNWARTRDFKAATHKQWPFAKSPVMWLQARCTQTRPLAGGRGQHGHCLSFDRQPIRGFPPTPTLGSYFLGAQATSQIGCEHLLLSNMPTRSPQCHNRPLIHTPSDTPTPYTPTTRWDWTHARCLINTKTCHRCPVSSKDSWKTSSYHADHSRRVQGGAERENKSHETFESSSNKSSWMNKTHNYNWTKCSMNAERSWSLLKICYKIITG